MKFKQMLSAWLQGSRNQYSYPKGYRSAASSPVIFYTVGKQQIVAVTLAQWNLN